MNCHLNHEEELHLDVFLLLVAFVDVVLVAAETIVASVWSGFVTFI